MEIEHINDDTIRVKIENSDLIERGVTFLDLLSNQKQIESFFYSILEEVDLDDDFKDSDAVTFQVMPKNNGLELFISKGANVDEDILSQFNEQANLSFNEYEAENQEDQPAKSVNKVRATKARNSFKRSMEKMIVFDNIERVIFLAHDLDDEFITSTLYHQDNHYYLHIAFDDEGDTNQTYRDLIFAKALEYGEESRITEDVLAEYGKLIIDRTAIHTLNENFK